MFDCVRERLWPARSGAGRRTASFTKAVELASERRGSSTSSSLPKLEPEVRATLMPFSFARERQFAATSAKLSLANLKDVSCSGDWSAGNPCEPVTDPGVVRVELDGVGKERRLSGV